mmetsp:Transcript_56673/g.149077  ORF Transcript_56673/g.149077 Transcript_56673/m.149077 type:complete len:368 (-) Transcript_56673:166-1269(-)
MCSVLGGADLPAPLMDEALAREQEDCFEPEESPMGSALCFVKRARAFRQMLEDPSPDRPQYTPAPVEPKIGGMDQAKLDSLAIDGGECTEGVREGLPQAILDAICMNDDEEVPNAAGHDAKADAKAVNDAEELLFLARRRRAFRGADAAAVFADEASAARHASSEEGDLLEPAAQGLSQAKLDALSVGDDGGHTDEDAEPEAFLLRACRAHAFRGAGFAAAFAEQMMQKATGSADAPTEAITVTPPPNEPATTMSSEPRTPRARSPTQIRSPTLLNSPVGATPTKSPMTHAWGDLGGLRLKDCDVMGTPDPALEKSFEQVATPQRRRLKEAQKGFLGSPLPVGSLGSPFSPLCGSPAAGGSPDLGGA